MDSGISPGDIGWLAGGAALVGAVQKLLRLLANWSDRRARDRERRLDAREKRLDERDHHYREHLEGELADLRSELEAHGRQLADALTVLQMTRVALSEVTIELEQHAPDSAAIKHAKALLNPTFRADLLSPAPTPAELARLAREVDYRRMHP